MAPLDRDHVLARRSESEPRALGHGRLVAFARTEEVLREFLADTGLRIAPSSDEKDFSDEEDEQTFLSGFANAVDEKFVVTLSSLV